MGLTEELSLSSVSLSPWLTSAIRACSTGSWTSESIPWIFLDEINQIREADRRARVFLRLAEFSKGVLPTETLVLDVSRLGQAKLGDGHLYSSLRAALDRSSAKRDANAKDALIAEVAMKGGHTLLTTDRRLATAVVDHDGAVRLFEFAAP